jgi:hypothetical protein
MFAAACSTNISGKITKTGGADLSLKTNLAPKTVNLLLSISGKMDGGAKNSEKNITLLDAEQINEALRQTQGVKSVALHNQSPQGIQGKVEIAEIDKFLSFAGNKTAPNARAFSVWQSDAQGGKLSVMLSRSNSQAILASISPDLIDYLSAIMAPCATGENLSKAEYVDLVASVYGKDIVSEIKSASFKASLTMPKSVKSVKGGTKTGDRADFDIPLLDILVLDKALVYEIEF